jgi:hypothetical protein
MELGEPSKEKSKEKSKILCEGTTEDMDTGREDTILSLDYREKKKTD